MALVSFRKRLTIKTVHTPLGSRREEADLNFLFTQLIGKLYDCIPSPIKVTRYII